MRRRIVHVVSHAQESDNGRLFSGLEDLCPVAFVDRHHSSEQADAVLLLDFPLDQALPGYCAGLPCFVARSDQGSPGTGEEASLQFGRADAVPRVFRQRTLTESKPPPPSATLPERPGDTVIARRAGAPIWVRRPQSTARGSIDVSSTPLPKLRSGQALGQYLNRDRFMGVLPLLDFCNRIGSQDQWSPASERACLIFDDVNLREVTYGCVDFRAMEASTSARRYHAAIALVPCDAGKVDARAAALFREHPQGLSILIHGNDHLKFELARERSADERLRVLAEARRRMLVLPQKHGLTVCTVQEPPYGVFQSGYVQPLLELGYEGVLCTASQFLECNPRFEESASFGAGAAECLGAGLAVIPRIPVSRNWETEAVLAAYLGQPVVMAGHHQDADGKLQYIEHVVDFVNGLGHFDWCDPSEIAATRYLWRRDGSNLAVRAFSRRLAIAVPEWATTVTVERAWMSADAREAMDSGARGSRPGRQVCGRISPAAPVAGSQQLVVTSPFATAVDPMTVPPPTASPWPKIRRTLAETRDRCYPNLPGFLRRRPGHFALRD